MLFLLEPFSEDPKKDYKLLLNELKEYNPALTKKPKIICITKADAIDEDRKNELRKLKIDRRNVFIISAHSGEGMNELMDKLAGIVIETK
jgi:GTP-binding protein